MVISSGTQPRRESGAHSTRIALSGGEVNLRQRWKKRARLGAKFGSQSMLDTIQCPSCKRTFATENDLYQHQRATHDSPGWVAAQARKKRQRVVEIVRSGALVEERIDA